MCPATVLHSTTPHYSTSFFLSRPTDKWTSWHHACTERQEDRQKDKKVYWLTLTNLYTFLFYFKHDNYSTTVPLHQWKTYIHRHKSLNMQQDWKTEQGICGMATIAKPWSASTMTTKQRSSTQTENRWERLTASSTRETTLCKECNWHIRTEGEKVAVVMNRMWHHHYQICCQARTEKLFVFRILRYTDSAFTAIPHKTKRIQTSVTNA